MTHVCIAVDPSLRRCPLRNYCAVALFPYAEDMRTQAGFTDDHLDRVCHSGNVDTNWTARQLPSPIYLSHKLDDRQIWRRFWTKFRQYPMNPSVFVIGAGPGGLASAILLAMRPGPDVARTVRSRIRDPGVPEARAFERRRRYEPACSGVVLYLGLKERYKHLACTSKQLG